jgi:hypothetical protein
VLYLGFARERVKSRFLLSDASVGDRKLCAGKELKDEWVHARQYGVATHKTLTKLLKSKIK